MNKETKNSIHYSFLLAILGGLYGLGIYFTLAVISVPKYGGLIFPKDITKNMEIFSRLANIFKSHWGVAIGIIFALIGYAVVFWFLKNLSSYENIHPYETAAKWKKFILFISSILLVAIFWSIQKLVNLPCFHFIKNEMDVMLMIIVWALPGILWIFASGKWLDKDKAESVSLGYIWCFLLGIAGAILIGCGIFNLSGNLAAPFYYFIKDILFYPDNTDFIFSSVKVLLLYALMFGFSGFFAAGITASVLYSFAPIKISLRVRLSRILPGLFFLIFTVIVFQSFKLYLHKFDYGKKSFVEAMSISDNKAKFKTVILLTKDKTGKTISKLKCVPMSVHLFSSFENLRTDYSHSRPVLPVSVTENNLKTIEEYIKNHERSFYLREANRILAVGYLMNWDSEKGYTARHIDAGGNLLSLMIELHSLYRFPVIEEYKKYLDGWADEEKYHHGPRSLLSFAKAYRHYGDFSKAKHFRDKVLEHPLADNKVKEEAKNLQFPSEGILMDGIIKGKILMDKNLPQPEKVGLFWADLKHQREPVLDGLTIGLSLISGQNIGKDGKFIFTNIGEGTYQLAFMFDNEKFSADEKIKVLSNPGFITLNKTFSMKDLGVIRISK